MSQRKGPMAMSVASKHEAEELELRRGPWTLEEDNLLMNYIACHGEGRWNLLARCSGLKRTGKSCRLRWLNYLKPDIKRGNLTPEEQLLILELHSKWGNRWSRIAQHLPGRTDNEIKNYWRTRLLEKMAADTSARLVEMPPQQQQLHPAHVGGVASPSPAHGSQQGQNEANAVSGGSYYHHQQHCYPVDLSPSTSTSGSGSTPAALPPVPCFSELSWVDQYGPGELVDGAGVFDSCALGSLGLDGLDLGPAACDYSDSTLLDYLNSTFTGSAMMVMGSGNVVHSSCGAMGGDGSTTWRTDELYCQAAARKLGDQWGGGI